MDEEAKLFLYKQLEEMVENNTKQDAPRILSREEFMSLPDNISLSYMFLYRDLFTSFVNENGESVIGYIELPSMDLSGQDLSMCFLHDFVLSTHVEEFNPIPSSINLKNTGAKICVTGIMPSSMSHDGDFIKSDIYDFNLVNFKGCEVYGFLPDEQNSQDVLRNIKIEGIENGFDDEYLSRREKRKTLDREEIAFAMRVYSRISNDKSLDGLSGIAKYERGELEGDFSDYDFSLLTEVSYRIDLKSYEKNTGWNIYKKCKNKFIEAFVDLEDLDILKRLEIIKKIVSLNEMDIDDEVYIRILDTIQAREGKDDNNYGDLYKYFENNAQKHGRFYFLRLESILKSESFDEENFKKILANGIEIMNYSDIDNLNLAIKNVSDEKQRKKMYDLLSKEIVKSKHDTGKYLYELIKKNPSSNLDFIISMIRNGADIEYVDYNSEWLQEKLLHKETPLLICATKIDDEETRKKVLEELFFAGVDLGVAEVSYTKKYIRDGENYEEKRALDNIELKKLHDESNVAFMAQNLAESIISQKKNNIQVFVNKNIINYRKDIIKYILQNSDIQEREKKDIILELIDKCLETGKEELHNYDYRDIIELALESQGITDENQRIDCIYGLLEAGNEEFYGYDYRYIILLVLKSEGISDSNQKIKLIESCLDLGKEKINKLEYVNIIRIASESQGITDENQRIKLIDRCLEDGKEKLDTFEFIDIINSIIKSDKITDGKEKIRLIEQCLSGAEFRFNYFYEMMQNLMSDNNASDFKNQLIVTFKEYTKRSISEEIKKEKSRSITQGKKEVSADGQLLNKLLDNPEKNFDFIIEFIDNGSNVNFISYKNNGGQPTYTPSIYKVMMIKNEELRRRIIDKMLEAGVDINAQYKMIDFNEEPPKTSTIRALDMNDGELKRIVAERKSNSYQPSRKIKSVNEFLKTEVGLSNDEIEALDAMYKKFDMDLSKESIDGLKIKNDILKACNSSHQGFTKNANILFNPVNVLYARLMFFAENGIKINPDRLEETMAISKKKFAQKYGRFLGVEDNGEFFANDVKRALTKKYPMPSNREKLFEKIREISLKNNHAT